MPKTGQLTLFQRVFLSAVSAPTVVKNALIDLGLGVGEIARILGIEIQMDTAVTADNLSYGQASVIVDPEATTSGVHLGQNKDIAYIRQRVQSGNATYEVVRTSTHRYFDYTGMNVLVIENMKFLASTSSGTGDAPAFNATVMVFFEKYKPTAQELNELILYRR